MKGEKSKINCPTFKKREPVIKDITDKINLVKEPLEKAKFAEELQKKAAVLLSCIDYNERSINCKNCHIIANLCKKTASLIIKAKNLRNKGVNYFGINWTLCPLLMTTYI